jgi:hypothetical protein
MLKLVLMRKTSMTTFKFVNKESQSILEGRPWIYKSRRSSINCDKNCKRCLTVKIFLFQWSRSCPDSWKTTTTSLSHTFDKKYQKSKQKISYRLLWQKSVTVLKSFKKIWITNWKDLWKKRYLKTFSPTRKW